MAFFCVLVWPEMDDIDGLFDGPVLFQLFWILVCLDAGPKFTFTVSAAVKTLLFKTICGEWCLEILPFAGKCVNFSATSKTDSLIIALGVLL